MFSIIVGGVCFILASTVGAKAASIQLAATVINHRQGHRPGEGVLTVFTEGEMVKVVKDSEGLGHTLFLVSSAFPAKLGWVAGKSLLMTSSEIQDLGALTEPLVLAVQRGDEQLQEFTLEPLVRALDAFPKARVYG
jgi:hypothetical protein